MWDDLKKEGEWNQDPIAFPPPFYTLTVVAVHSRLEVTFILVKQDKIAKAKKNACRLTYI